MKYRLIKKLMVVFVMVIVVCGCTPRTDSIGETVIVEREIENTVIVVEEIEKLVTQTQAPSPAAKYIFVFIGDGMGVAQRYVADLYLASVHNPEHPDLLMNAFPAQGMTTTYDLTSVIPDSASTATSIATGYKTASGVVGMNAEGTEVYVNLAEIAKAAGLKVGIVSSVSIDHATPAAFYSHQASRSNYYEIDIALANSDFDYFAGGNIKSPTGPEDDQPDAYEAAIANGFVITTTREEFDALGAGAGKVWAISPYSYQNVTDSDSLYYEIDRPADDISIVEFVSKGIELLDNENGFFMMVEGGKIDWACHANDAGTAIMDTLALDAAVAEAYDFYLEHPDETLIVVTGDHETGGMIIGFAGTRYSSYLDRLQYQSMSFVSFSKIAAGYIKEFPYGRLSDLYDEIEEAFGLLVRSDEEVAALQAAADAGEADAIAELGMVLSKFEMIELENAFRESLSGGSIYSRDEYTYLLYGNQDALTSKLITLLNQKAGIGWTSYSHTAMPVQTSAVGVGAEAFNGYYDNSDIFTKIMEIAGFEN